MIPLYELRIGNYILFDKKLRRISMLNTQAFSISPNVMDKEEGHSNGVGNYPLDRLEPVPLSDALLVRSHFIYNDYFRFWRLIEGIDEARSEMDIDNDYNVIDFMRRPVAKKLTALHQLQNIYHILKGKELELDEKVETPAF